ncbi:hypothetical protein EV715DRAFT_210390 [Schizophyllum commune]
MERADSPNTDRATSLDSLIDAYLIQTAISPPPSTASLPLSAASLPSSSLPPLLPPTPATPSTLAYLVLSSGTSGLPKAVIITHGNLIASLFQVLVATLPPSPFYSASTGSDTPPPSDTTPPHPTLLAFLPMYHSYGLHTHIFRNFLTPTTTVVMRKWEVGRAMRLVERYKITTLTLVPSVVHQLVTLASSSPSNTGGRVVIHEDIRTALAGVSALMCGAAHLPADLRDRFLKTCAPHATLSAVGPPPDALAVGPPPDALAGSTATPRGSVGKLMPGLKAKIVRGEEDGLYLSGPLTGELYLSGPTIAAGYYNNPDATRETFVDESGEGSKEGEENGARWLKTGDRFYVDRDGWFFFSDRAKDTLKVSGAQVSPREIEEVVLAWRGEGVGGGEGEGKGLDDLRVLDVAVAGVRGHGRTADERVPRAWVVLDTQRTAAAPDTQRIVAALHTWTRARLSRHKWLRGGIEVVGEIPKNPTGKVLRRVLVERYERGLVEREERGLEEQYERGLEERMERALEERARNEWGSDERKERGLEDGKPVKAKL